MRLRPHQVKEPVWTESDYGEPTATLGTARTELIAIGWTSSAQADTNNTLYQKYEFVGLTRATIVRGSVIDDLYEVGHIDNTGRWNRIFMNYVEGYNRTYTVATENE